MRDGEGLSDLRSTLLPGMDRPKGSWTVSHTLKTFITHSLPGTIRPKTPRVVCVRCLITDQIPTRGTIV